MMVGESCTPHMQARVMSILVLGEAMGNIVGKQAVTWRQAREVERHTHRKPFLDLLANLELASCVTLDLHCSLPCSYVFFCMVSCKISDPQPGIVQTECSQLILISLGGLRMVSFWLALTERIDLEYRSISRGPAGQAL